MLRHEIAASDVERAELHREVIGAIGVGGEVQVVHCFSFMSMRCCS